MIELRGGEFLANKTYQIDYLYKKGGQSYIYIATHQKLNKKLVIKQTELIGSSSTNAIEEEGKILCHLDHPALPKIYNLFEEKNCVFLVMDYILGEDLNSLLLKNGKPFQASLVINWLSQLLDILDYLEISNVIHLDIKPKNIIIDNGNKLYLIDFGFVKKLDADHLFKGGTENYASPEQLNDLEVDIRSSIYSLSATAYRLLTNDLPFDALEREKHLLSENYDPLIQIQTKNPKVPKNLSDLIFIGLDLNPNERLQSVSVFKELLVKARVHSQNLDEISEITISQQKSRFDISSQTNNQDISSINTIKHLLFDKDILINNLINIKEESEASRLLFCVVDVIDANIEKKQQLKNRFESLVGGISRIEHNNDLLIIWAAINYVITYPNSLGEEKIRKHIIHRWKKRSKMSNKSVNKFDISRKQIITFIRISLITALITVILFLFWYC